MATDVRSDRSSQARRREILEWYFDLEGKEPAQVLRVSPDAEPAAVKAAFTALAKRFHPDTLDPDHADLRKPLEAIFARITSAYRDLQKRDAQDTPRPARRPAPVSRLPRREVTAPPTPGPRPGPALSPDARRARVAEALEAATAHLAEADGAAAVSRLHEVLGLADDVERRRVRLLLARAYVSEPRWRRYGVSLLGELLRESPDDADALTILGALYLREGLMARAEATLRRALKADPGHLEARGHLRAVNAALERRRGHGERRPPERRALLARLLSFTREKEERCTRC